MESEFEIVGYSYDVKYMGKWCGYVICEEQANRKWGYSGRRTELAKTNLVTSQKHKIPAGAIIETEYHPICGKLKSKETWSEQVN